MPKTGIDLMKAKGLASPTVGDNFRDDIVNLDGANGLEYVHSGITFSGTVPVDDLPGGYGENVTFAITANHTAGSRWPEIRYVTSGAWAFSINETSAEVSLDSFAAYASPLRDEFVMRVKGKRTASPSAGTPSTVSDDAGGSSAAMPVTYTAVLTGLTTSGQTLLTITPQYIPDAIHPFNDTIFFGGIWSGYFNNRGYDQDADFDYQWRTAASGGGSLLSSSRSFKLTFDGANEIYPTSTDGLFSGEAANTIYLRWRIKPSSGGNGTWNEYGAVNHTDPRDPE